MVEEEEEEKEEESFDLNLSTSSDRGSQKIVHLPDVEGGGGEKIFETTKSFTGQSPFTFKRF